MFPDVFVSPLLSLPALGPNCVCSWRTSATKPRSGVSVRQAPWRPLWLRYRPWSTYISTPPARYSLWRSSRLSTLGKDFCPQLHSYGWSRHGQQKLNVPAGITLALWRKLLPSVKSGLKITRVQKFLLIRGKEIDNRQTFTMDKDISDVDLKVKKLQQLAINTV